MNKTSMAAGIAAGTVFGVAVGVVTPSLAADNTTSTSVPTSAVTSAQKADSAAHHLGLARARNVIHATWVTRNGVHHRAIRGTVQAVSSRSITIRATDGVRETYVVTASTVVRVRGDGHKGKDPISAVHVGDRALVAGKGGSTAAHVLAAPPKKASTGGTASSED